MTTALKHIETSLFDFPQLMRGGSVYVDKTARIYELARPGTDRVYFFPRPRRFGKSLLISTLKALFQGRRDLFKGLAIEKTDWDWANETYPVLHLDMSKASCTSAAEMEVRLSKMLQTQFEIFNLSYDENAPAVANFIALLDALPNVSRRMRDARRKAAGLTPARDDPNDGKYVLLIDEYDAPIAGMLDTPEKRMRLGEIRAVLHNFYVVAKANCGDIRFLMVTGVSKFAKTSIFSAFNNPKDLSLDARAADLVGYTHEEMETYFHDHIQAFAEARGETYEQAFDELLSWYDSYQFCPERAVRVVNPVSLGNALSSHVLKGYWEATAGSTLIFDALEAANKAPFDFADAFSLSTLDAPDALEAPTVALLYQGGYLTIDKRIDDETVLLKVPNHEVAQFLMREYLRRNSCGHFNIDAFEQSAKDFARQLAESGVNYSPRKNIRTVNDVTCVRA